MSNSTADQQTVAAPHEGLDDVQEVLRRGPRQSRVLLSAACVDAQVAEQETKGLEGSRARSRDAYYCHRSGPCSWCRRRCKEIGRRPGCKSLDSRHRSNDRQPVSVS
jgi:hypothetical protein